MLTRSSKWKSGEWCQVICRTAEHGASQSSGSCAGGSANIRAKSERACECNIRQQHAAGIPARILYGALTYG